jgi:hypothetical protein
VDLTANVSELTVYDWYDCVEKYSACELTNESDKLPAIAGIANVMMSHNGRPYFASLRLDHLQCGLMWNPIETVSVPKSKRAPSWSWASYDGRIQYNKRHLIPVPEMWVVGISDRPGGVESMSRIAPEGPSCLEIRTAIRTVSGSSRLGNIGCDPTTGAWGMKGRHFCSFRLLDDLGKENGGRIVMLQLMTRRIEAGKISPRPLSLLELGLKRTNQAIPSSFLQVLMGLRMSTEGLE